MINSLSIIISPRNSPQQSAIAEGFVKANSVFIVITSAIILPRWLFRNKIYIQFIQKYIFLNKIIVYKQDISLACAIEVSVCATRSQINYIFLVVYSSSFSSFMWQWNKLCFQVLYHRISEVLWRHIFKQLLFCFILLPFVHLPAPKKNKTCDIKVRLSPSKKKFFYLLQW